VDFNTTLSSVMERKEDKYVCKLCLFEPTCVSLSLTFVLPISKYIKYVVKQIQCTQCPFRLRSTSVVLKTISLIHLKKNQRLILLMWKSRPSIFQTKLSRCGLLYFHVLYNMLDFLHWLSFDFILNYLSEVQCLITHFL